MDSRWFGRLSYISHELQTVEAQLVGLAKDHEVQTDLRNCGCPARVAVVNCVLLEVDIMRQTCQICGELLLHLTACGRGDCGSSIGDRVVRLLEIQFLKTSWAIQLCENGDSE
jgi:hypothetical protein